MMNRQPSAHHLVSYDSHGMPPVGQALLSVRLAVGALAAMIAAAALYAVTVAVWGVGATEDNWVGVLVVLLGGVGLLTSLVAFALAVRARAQRVQWAWLWLPLWVFPLAMAFIVLGEAFWWE